MKFAKGTPAGEHADAGHTIALDVDAQTPYCVTCKHHVGEFTGKKDPGSITQKTARELLSAGKLLRDALAKGDPQYSMNPEEGNALNRLDSAITKAEKELQK